MSSQTAPPAQRFLGPIKLAPGVAPAQIGIFLIVIIAAICMLNFLPLVQAYIFNEILHIPRNQQGVTAGNLATVQQLAMLLCVGVWGALADRIGRRKVLLMALCGYCICLSVYPLSSTLTMLFCAQFLYGVAWSAHTAGGATMMVDFPDNGSRGKFTGLMIVVQGIAGAIVVGWLGARIPAALVANGVSPALAGRYACWAVAGFGVIGLVLGALFLKNPKPPVGAGEKKTISQALAGFKSDYQKVLAHARKNPRFGLVVMMGFVIRSDYAVILSFMSLWVINAASGQGVSSVDALKTAGTLLAVFKIATLVSPLLFGLVADRVNRTILLVLSLALTGTSLCATLFISDVMGLGIHLVVAAIGITESALIISSQSVFGEEAPGELRGAAMGMFSMVGIVSVVFISFIGGHLFDSVGYSAPFVLVGILNLLFAVLGAYLVFKSGDRAVFKRPVSQS
ncbi:MFS transporter [Duganella sp. BuS-21]|uniref:MFS transporter n=1 Tax=Duganella sp. BuS-21 TaxID=2943848 RepID=UPI0035A6B135